MSRKKKVLVWLAAFGMLAAGAGLQAQTVDGVKNIKLTEDRDQRYMISKVYELKNIRQDDITPWLLGAVQRYRPASMVTRLNYKAGGKHYIVVTTGQAMMPYVDAMVAQLDRPSATKDEASSIVDGSGIYNFTYRPKYRGGDAMITTIIRDTRSDGFGWYSADNNLFYWKDSKFHGTDELKWLSAIDRPVPQMSVKLNVYTIADNDFKELGLDWLDWKNGPGASLFGAGYDLAKYQGTSELASQTLSSMSGFMIAPQFDSTFIKMMQEKGKARNATSGNLTVINDYANNGTYNITFSPNYEAINTASGTRTLSVASESGATTFSLTITSPCICFGSTGDKANQLLGRFNLNVKDPVDQANVVSGSPVGYENQTFVTTSYIKGGSEKLLATYTKDHQVKEVIGLPYLCDIPVLKYIFGSTSQATTHDRIFVTLSAEAVAEGSNYSQWAGKVIEATALPEAK